MGISCSKTLKIIGAPAINISSGSGCIQAGEDIVMEGALLTCLGHGANIVEASGNVRIRASMLNLANGILHIDGFGNVYDGAALYASGNIDITASVLTINSCAYGIEAYGESINLNYVAASIVSYQECVRSPINGAINFSHVNLNAASKEMSAISIGDYGSGCYGTCDTTPIFSEEDDCHYRITLGDGNYTLYSPMHAYGGKIGVAAIWCRRGRVILSGGDVKCCAPRGNLVYTGGFEMTGGSLQPVKSADFSSNCKMIMGEAAVSALMMGSGIWNDWTGTQAAFLTIMGNQLIDMLPELDEGWPKVIIHVQEFRQTGGEIIQGEADYGYFSEVSKSVYSKYSDEEIARYVSTPILAGGSFNGYFFAHGWYDSYDPEPSSRGREFYRPISPVDASGRILTHVDYSPYWEYRGAPSNTDLLPCPIQNWSGPLVMAKRANDFMGTTSFAIGDEIYVHLAVLNQGADILAPFVVSIYLDGVYIGYEECPGLRNGYYRTWTNCRLGVVAPGQHRLMMGIDSSNVILETDESNNRYSVDFTIIDNRVMVSLNPQGGTVEPGDSLVCPGVAVGILPEPVKEGCRFLGWYTAAVGGTRVTAETVVTKNVTFYAHWWTGEKPILVPGEKVEIDTGLVGYTASGLPNGLKYDKNTGKITGSASKPTAAEGAVVKFTKKGFETEELTIVVTAIPKVTVRMEGVNSPGDTDGCKVTGAGAYLVGKKVTLKATAPKGTVFLGWAAAEDGGSTEEIVSKNATFSFTMDKEDVALVAKFKKEVMSVGCETLTSKESFPAGVLGAEGGIALDISTESGVKSVKVDKLPAGMKYDAKSERITGAPTKAGDNTVVITVTAVSGAVAKKEIEVKVAAMPVMAVGTFTGFVSVGEDTFGTFTLTTTDAGKLTAKVVTAAGTVSFSGTCWDAVVKGVYRATLTTKKGEKLTLMLDSTVAWDANQLWGEFATAAIAETKKTAAVPSRTYSVSAQKNAFGKTWYFTAVGNETTGWTLDYAATAKAAALTVTLKADGTTAIAGSLPGAPDKNGKATTFKVSASGYANVGLVREGAIAADFAPVLTVNKMKTILAIKTNLWFDRKSDHGSGVGEAQFVK